ncbi:MAG: nucleotidyltransferase domain-containing protein [Candidatus Pacearchaeota archaeon]
MKEIKKEIIHLLKEIEKKNNIKILFAVESGSREWGFASKDSDYDVRAVHFSPVNKYLSIEQIKEQIELVKRNIDIVSWDIKKFISLFLKSNPTVSEWLKSKIVYKDSKYRNILSKEFDKGFSREAIKKHYVSLSRQNYEKYIRNKREVNLKKYVYVLRAIGCVNFLMKENTSPPLNYKELLPYLPKNIADFINLIVEKKKKSEKILGSVNEEINNYIESYFNIKFEKSENYFNIKKINNFVIKIIKNQGK